MTELLTLRCAAGDHTWERAKGPGRIPTSCPDHRSASRARRKPTAAEDAARAEKAKVSKETNAQALDARVKAVADRARKAGTARPVSKVKTRRVDPAKLAKPPEQPVTPAKVLFHDPRTSTGVAGTGLGPVTFRPSPSLADRYRDILLDLVQRDGCPEHVFDRLEQRIAA